MPAPRDRPVNVFHRLFGIVSACRDLSEANAGLAFIPGNNGASAQTALHPFKSDVQPELLLYVRISPGLGIEISWKGDYPQIEQ